MEGQNRNEGEGYNICFFMVTEDLIKNKSPILEDSSKNDIKEKVSKWYEDVYLKPDVTESKSYVHTDKIGEYIRKLNDKEKSKTKGDPIGKSGAKPYFTRMNFGKGDVDVVIKVFNSRKKELNDKYVLFMGNDDTTDEKVKEDIKFIKEIRAAEGLDEKSKIRHIIDKLNPKSDSTDFERIKLKEVFDNHYSRSAIEPLLVSQLMSKKNDKNGKSITPEIYDVGFVVKKGNRYDRYINASSQEEEAQSEYTNDSSQEEEAQLKSKNKRLIDHIVGNNLRLNLKIICELISTIKSFHEAITTKEQKIGCHRDLHPGNIILCNIPENANDNVNDVHVKLFDFDLSVDDTYTQSMKCKRYPPGGAYSLFGNNFNVIAGTREWCKKNGIIYYTPFLERPFRYTTAGKIQKLKFIMEDADLYQLFTYIYVILKKSQLRNIPEWLQEDKSQNIKVLSDFLENSHDKSKDQLLEKLYNEMKAKSDSATQGGLKRRKTKRKSKNKKRVTRRKRNKRK